MGGGPRGHRPRKPRRARSVLAGFVFGAVMAIPAVSYAGILTQNFQRASVTVGDPLVQAYDYQLGSNQTWQGTADFDLGTFTDTIGDLEEPAATPLDRLTLEPIGPDGVVAPNITDIPWWDTSWNTRHCLELDHTDPAASSVTEYQYRVEFDDLDQLALDGLVQADFGDFRAIAADGATQLPMWVDANDDAVWVQVDQIDAAATTHFCLYFGHETGSQVPLANHSEVDVFTYSTPKDLYYAVHDNYGSGAGVQVDIASLVDGNTITRDGVGTTSQTLNSGELSTFDGMQPSSVISATGPLTGRVGGVAGAGGATGRGDGYDSLMPISWANTNFLIPSERRQQRVHIYAPFATSTVRIYEGANVAPIATVVVPVGQAVWIEPVGDPINNESIVVEADVPVLVMHDRTDSGNDVYPVVPFLDDEWFGVSSTTRASADTTTTHVDQYQSNTAVEVDRALTRGQYVSLGSGGSQGGGVGSGTRLVLDTDTIGDPEVSPPGATFAAVTQADSDGNEIATFFPRQELNNRYLIPTNLQYVAFSCPDPNVDIVISAPGVAPVTVTCTGAAGSTVGWAKHTANLNVVRSTAGAVPTPGEAIEVASTDGKPFYVYYEHRASNDEANVLGMKQARQLTWPAPVETIRLEGLFPEQGTWLSPTFLTPATTGVFGELNFTGEFDPGTTNIRVQVATGTTLPPTDFVGPDGTTGSFFDIEDLPLVLDFDHDGDDHVRLLVTLVTTDKTVTPRVESVGFDYDLPLINRPLGVASPIAVETVATPEVQSDYLIRLKTNRTDVAGSEVRLLDGGATASVVARTLRLENVALAIDSTQTTGGTSTPDGPQPFGPGQSLSVLGDFSLASVPDTGSLVVLVHVDVQSGGIIAETDLDVQLETNP